MSERRGVPALGVMTVRFASAAQIMGRALGLPGYPFAVIDHPISSATDDQLRAMARATMEQARRLLLAP